MNPHDLAGKVMEHFQSGGALMLPLTGIALIMWTLSIVKLLRFLREKRREAPLESCLDFCRDAARTCPGPAQWQFDILSQFLQERCEDPQLNQEMLAVMRARQESKATRHIATIMILSAVAPLLGLLGTVTGMITTFDVISQFGTGNVRAMASGISEALITTQSGLVVAVPGMLLGGILFRRAEKLKARMKLFCIRLEQTAPAATTPRSLS